MKQILLATIIASCAVHHQQMGGNKLLEKRIHYIAHHLETRAPLDHGQYCATTYITTGEPDTLLFCYELGKDNKSYGDDDFYIKLENEEFVLVDDALDGTVDRVFVEETTQPLPISYLNDTARTGFQEAYEHIMTKLYAATLIVEERERKKKGNEWI